MAAGHGMDAKTRWATPLLAILGAMLVAGIVRVDRLPQTLVAHSEGYVPLFLACFILYTLAVLLVQRYAPQGRAVLATILGVALACRLAALAQPPSLSTDIYRYMWDGHISSLGLNPYRFAPDAPQLGPYRTPYWRHVNHKNMVTMYPPVSQAFFLAVNHVGGQKVRAYKVAVVLADLAALILVLLLLRAAGRPLAWAVVYAWHPLVVMEVAGSGHQDALGVALMTGALLAAASESRPWRSAAAGALAGLAAMAKGYIVPAVPILARRRPWLFLPAAATAALPLIALYWGDGALIVGLTQYLEHRPRNAGIYVWATDALAGRISDPAGATRLLMAGVLALVVARMSLRPARDVEELAGRTVAAIGTLLLLSPTVYPWYAVWLLPGICLRFSPGWFLLTGLISMAYLNPVPNMNPWVPSVEYTPVLLFLAWEAWRRRRACRHQARAT